MRNALASHAGNVMWLSIVIAGLRAMLPVASAAAMVYTFGSGKRLLMAMWRREPTRLVNWFGAGLFGYIGTVGLGFFGKRVYFAIVDGRSLGFDQGAVDQWSTLALLIGGSLFALMIVYAASKGAGDEPPTFRSRLNDMAVPLTVFAMVLASVSFAAVYAWQQGAI